MVARARDAPAAPNSVPTPTEPVAQSAPTQETPPAPVTEPRAPTNPGATTPSSDQPERDEPNASATVNATSERDEPNLTAEEAYDRAIRAYAAGDKVAALSFMEQSYELSKLPELLYNIAKIERELDQCASALATYQRYLDDAPTATQRDAAIDGVRVLSAECLHPAPTDVSKASTLDVPSTYWTTPHVVGWSAIIAGAAAGAASLGLGLASNSDARAYLDYLHAEMTPKAPPYRFNSERGDAARLRSFATVFGIAGGALAAGGVLCLTFWHERRERSAPSVSLELAPGGAALGYSRHF